MSSQRLKMFSPERISIILLVAAICAWGAVTMCRRIPDGVTTTLPEIPSGDTAVCNRVDSTAFAGKKSDTKKHRKNTGKNRATRKAKTKQKKAVKHRDHLNEPVSTD